MNYLKLSKKISHVLRHAPEEFSLKMDRQGFVQIEQLLSGLNAHNHFGGTVGLSDLEYIIAYSEKQRYEIVGDKIRALYGHSFSMKIQKEKAEPPAVLYHGTAKRFVESIKEKGLLPMGRQYVHLSTDVETAISVGMRRDEDPVILEIDAQAAFRSGIKFYIGNDKVWLCDELPVRYIKNLP